MQTCGLAGIVGGVAALAGCGHHYTAAERYDDSLRGSSAVALTAARDPDPNAPELVGRGDMLSVMSFNMAQRDRPKDFLAMADDLRVHNVETPDFIMLQEVLFDRAKNGPEPSTAAAFAADLGYFCRATQRSNDDEGIGILSRYPFLHYESRLLQTQTSKLWLGKDRVSVMGEFRVPDIGMVRVINVHLTNWAASGEVRQAQLSETLQWIAECQRNRPVDVIIVGGDFNIQPGWTEMNVMFDKTITGGIVYRDYNDRSVPTFGKSDGVTKRVDYIFIATPGTGCTLKSLGEQCLWREGVTVASTGRRFLPSDHEAVLQKFRVEVPQATAQSAGGAGGATAAGTAGKMQ